MQSPKKPLSLSNCIEAVEVLIEHPEEPTSHEELVAILKQLKLLRDLRRNLESLLDS